MAGIWSAVSSVSAGAGGEAASGEIGREGRERGRPQDPRRGEERLLRLEDERSGEGSEGGGGGREC